MSHIPVFNMSAQHLATEHDIVEMTLGRAGCHGIMLLQVGLPQLLTTAAVAWIGLSGVSDC